MPTPRGRFLLCAFAVSALVGCTDPGVVSQQPVENRPTLDPLRVYDVGEVTVAPYPTNRVAPDYPFELRKNGVSGRAVIAFTVRTDGSVTDVTIVDATHPAFGKAAAKAISRWSFYPGLVGGVPVNCRMAVPISFNLDRNH